jgi:hypothetical protein
LTQLGVLRAYSIVDRVGQSSSDAVLPLEPRIFSRIEPHQPNGLSGGSLRVTAFLE